MADARRACTLAAAVTGIVGLCSAFAASAVYLNPDGLGQVLLYPYYTTRATDSGNAYNTLIEVTNTFPQTKALRIRFREARNGRPVAEFNLFLVPFDSWSGALAPGAEGPRLVTVDASCTAPPLAAGSLVLSNEQYSKSNADGEETSLRRAETGYVEVIELGEVTDPAMLAALVPNRADDGFNVRPDCDTARALPLAAGAGVAPPTGGLMGNAYVVNVAEGTLYPYAATALDAFSAVSLWSAATLAAGPTLEDVNPKVSDVFHQGVVRRSHWDVEKGARPVDPVSAVLMQNRIINAFVLDAATRSATDWIVTMPTKPHLVQAGKDAASRQPFESAFGTGGAPDYFGVAPTGLAYPNTGNSQVYSREGYFLEGDVSYGPNPPPPSIMFRWTANVGTFDNSKLLASEDSVWLGGGNYENGWAVIEPFQYAALPYVHRLVSTDSPPDVYFGLPMIGFMAHDYVNGALGSPGSPVLSNYGATSPHRGVRRIE